MEILELTSAQTHPLRRLVLRDNDPTRSVTYPEDDDPNALHLGVRDGSGAIVATSTWIPRQCPDVPAASAIQLRGMATEASVRGTGIGGRLFEAGIARFADLGHDLVWARARDAALGFYTSHGCVVVGEGFVDEATNLPHHIVVRRLR